MEKKDRFVILQGTAEEVEKDLNDIEQCEFILIHGISSINEKLIVIVEICPK